MLSKRRPTKPTQKYTLCELKLVRNNIYYCTTSFTTKNDTVVVAQVERVEGLLNVLVTKERQVLSYRAISHILQTREYD